MRKRKRWKSYHVGPYRLGQKEGRAVAFWYDENGRKKQTTLGATNESAAKTQLDQFAANAELIMPAEQKTVGELFEAYLIEKEKDGKNLTNMLNSWRVLAPRFKDAIPKTITEDTCRDYARDRFELGLAPSTVWTELLQLRTVINWAEDTKRLKEDDAPYIWLPRPSLARERYMTGDEIKAFMKHATTPHIQLFFIMALTTGARSGAILDLKWDQIDFEAGIIDLRGEYKIDPMKKVKKKRRSIQRLTSIARAALLKAKEGRQTDYVIEWNGSRVKSIKKSFKRTCQRAGIEGVSPHTVRHTTGTLMRQKVSLEVVSEWLGHSSPQITKEVYAKTTPEYFDDAALFLDDDMLDDNTPDEE